MKFMSVSVDYVFGVFFEDMLLYCEGLSVKVLW